jgi:hypothetical protein
VCDVCRGLTRVGRRARVVVRADGFIPSQQRRRSEGGGVNGAVSEPAERVSEERVQLDAPQGSDEEDDEVESGSGLIEVGEDDWGDTVEEKKRLKRPRDMGENGDSDGVMGEVGRRAREDTEEVRAWKRARLTERAGREVERDELVNRLDDWTKVGCSVCWAQGQIQGARRARGRKECREHEREAGERMEEVTKKIKQLHMARFSECQFCWVPQSICQRWEEKTAARGSKRAGYQRSRVAGAGCQYRGVMEEIGGAMMSQRMETREEGEGREWEWVEGEMESTVGFWEGGGREKDRWGDFGGG